MDTTYRFSNLRVNTKKYLVVLARNQDLNVASIAREVGVSSSPSAYNVLSKLIEKDLVGKDYWNSTYYLTETGWQWLCEHEDEIDDILLYIERAKAKLDRKLELQKEEIRERIIFLISYLKEDDFDEKSDFLNFLSREVGCTKQDLKNNMDLWRNIAPPIPGIKAKCYFNHKVFANQTLFLEWLSSETEVGIGTLKKYEDAWIDFSPEPQAGPKYRKLRRDMLRQQIEEMKEELEQKKLIHGRTDFMK